MTCLGGTADEPAVWYDYRRTEGDPELAKRGEGRVCRHLERETEGPRKGWVKGQGRILGKRFVCQYHQRATNPERCSSCILYRPPGQPRNVVRAVDGSGELDPIVPYVMSEREHELYQAWVAIDAEDEPDESIAALSRYECRVLHLANPYANKAAVARFRAKDPEHARALNREHQRAWRSRQRLLQTVSNRTLP